VGNHVTISISVTSVAWGPACRVVQ